jgi:hypothetical protein
MAGFQVSTNGRFWVSTEACARIPSWPGALGGSYGEAGDTSAVRPVPTPRDRHTLGSTMTDNNA